MQPPSVPSALDLDLESPGAPPSRPDNVPSWLSGAVLVCCVVFVALLDPRPVAADLWYQHYQRAERALEQEDWPEAVEQLNQAIERRGDSGVRVRTYGMRTEDYFPYLKLGVAYFGLGQVQAALQAFETEERLEAIQQSEDALAELGRLRALALVERDRSLVAEEEKRRKLVAASLDEARALAGQDRIDEAMEALARGQAIAPEDASVLELSAELRTRIRSREEARETRLRVASWTREGRERLIEGSFAEASSLFGRALDAAPGDPELADLLSRAQAGLRAEVEAVRRAEDRQALLADSLADARALAAAGDVAGALERLQPALATEPEDADLAALAGELAASLAEIELDTSRRMTLDAALAEGETRFGEGSWEAAVASANLALATDPGNKTALDLLGRSYRRINEDMLGLGVRGNLPPAIRFADFRDVELDGVRWQQTDDSSFRLTGVVIDESPVGLSVLAEGDRPLEAVVTSQPLGEFHLTEFQVLDELPAGQSSFRLVATDAEELTASSRYGVIYQPPIQRRRAFWLLVGLLVAAAGTVVGLNRRRKRNRLRKRRFNPYIAGAPVLDEDLFFGRERLADRILQTIHNNSLLIYGERRIGKTSLQHYLKRRLELMEDPTYEFHPVYVDLQGVPEDRFFGVLAEEVFQELEPVLEGLEPATDPGEDREYDHRSFVRDLRAVLKVLAGRTSKHVKLVLLVDEVDELNDYDPRINQRLRSLFMKSFAEHLVAVVSGVEIKKVWEREGSPWYNFFEEIEMRPLSEDEARELVERPIRGALKVEPGVVEEVLRRTGCRPYLIQKTCVSLVNRAYEQGRRVIGMADLEGLLEPDDAPMNPDRE